jgi:hypothetical protein
MGEWVNNESCPLLIQWNWALMDICKLLRMVKNNMVEGLCFAFMQSRENLISLREC